MQRGNPVDSAMEEFSHFVAHDLPNLEDPGAEPMGGPADLKLSVVMGVHPSFVDSTRHVLADLARGTVLEGFEVIVVLDGPPGEYEKMWKVMLLSLSFPTRLFSTKSATNRTGDAQRDVGIAMAFGDFVTCLDDDDQLTPWYMETVMSIAELGMEKGTSSGSFLMLRDGFVIGRTLARKEISGQLFVVRADIAKEVPFNQRPGKVPRPGHDDYATDWLWIKGCLDLADERPDSNHNMVHRVCMLVDSYKHLRPEVAG